MDKLIVKYWSTLLDTFCIFSYTFCDVHVYNVHANIIPGDVPSLRKYYFHIKWQLSVLSAMILVKPSNIWSSFLLET